MAKDRETQQKAKDQAVRIAHDLGIQRKPPLLKTLDCIGFVQDWDNSQFGLLFQVPDQADVVSGPVSLHSWLARAELGGRPIPLPTLAHRIRLARDLAYTLAELHFAGILHRALHSGNVLLFPDRVTKSVSSAVPYLGGFGASRLEQDESLSQSVHQGPFDDYKHPELRDTSSVLAAGGSRRTFRRRYDVYSLGLVLLEIGLWRPLQSLPRGNSAAETANRFLSAARTFLPHHMGTIYCEAVVDCIDFVRPWLSDMPTGPSGPSIGDLLQNDDDKPGEHLILFVEKVVRRLEACQCQN